MTKVTVMMGGPSAEHAVSLASGATVVRALAELGSYEVDCLTITPQGQWIPSLQPLAAPIVPHTPHRRPDRVQTLRGLGQLATAEVVFLALHGEFGEDGTIQSVMQCLGIAYTGSGPLASALAMDKSRAKQCLQFHGIPVPREYYWRDGRFWDSAGRQVLSPFPLVVKPNRGGSSVGICVVDRVDQWLPYPSEEAMLIEERVQGREFTCAVLETSAGGLEALPVIEVRPRRGDFFNFESKYSDEGADELCPAPISADRTLAIQKLAVAAHQALGCEGFSRTDLLWETGGGPKVLEVNTIPGLTPNSLLPKAARAHGIALPQLMGRLVELARQRG